MKLILTEKFNVAQKIANVLGNMTKRDLHYESDEYYVCWAQGHLVGFISPDKYNDSWKKWELSQLPMIPNTFITEVSPTSDRKSLFYNIKKLMNSKEVDEIICATDTGREGQLIFELIYNETGCRKPVFRLWFNSLEPNEIKRAFNHIESNVGYLRYAHSASARSKADWLVGMNLTRLYTVLYGPFSKSDRLFHVGRVQTPTLAMIVERFHDVNNFKKSYYHEVDAEFDGFNATWFNEQGTEIHDKADALSILKDCSYKNAVVSEVITKKIIQNRPKLFYLTELQREANTRYNLSPDITLDYAQKLYEKGLITYPRTDSAYLTKDFTGVIPNLIDSIFKTFSFSKPIILSLLKKGYLIDNNIIDDSKVSDHHAILITSEIERYDLGTLTENELNILKLIIERLLMAVDQKYIYNEIKTIFQIDKHFFRYISREILQKGWKELYDSLIKLKDSEDKTTLSFMHFNKADVLKPLSIVLKDKETQPERYYSFATILSAMEHAGKKITDLSLRTEMKSISLGTEATRGNILKELVTNNYINVINKSLIPTEKGLFLISKVPESVKHTDLTGFWEKQLDMIKDLQLTENDFVHNIENYIKDVVNNISKTTVFLDKLKEKDIIDSAPPRSVIAKCPICDSDIFENTSSFYCSKWNAHGKKKCLFRLWKNDFTLKNFNIILSIDEIKSIVNGGSIKCNINSNTYDVRMAIEKNLAVYKVSKL